MPMVVFYILQHFYILSDQSLTTWLKFHTILPQITLNLFKYKLDRTRFSVVTSRIKDGMKEKVHCETFFKCCAWIKIPIPMVIHLHCNFLCFSPEYGVTTLKTLYHTPIFSFCVSLNPKPLACLTHVYIWHWKRQMK